MAGRAPRGAEAPVDGRRLRWTAHRQQRRAAFVAAGAEAIDRHGPGASAEQIAEAAGISRTVLYRYFRDRDDLRQAIAQHVANQVLGSVMPKLQLTAESTPRQIIGAAIGTVVGWLDEHPNLYLFLRSGQEGGLETVATTLADAVAALLKLLLGAFGVEAEEAEPGAYGVVGFVESAGGWWLRHRSMTREVFTEHVCTGVWHILEGSARDHGLTVEYDGPLPIARALAARDTAR